MFATGPIVVIGSTGQVARALGERAALRDVAIVSLGRMEIDLAAKTDPTSILAAHAPSALINAAAYTAVDAAESDEQTAFAVNAEGPRRLARAAKSLGIPLVHISTDYVFDGEKHGSYLESDPVSPINAYGRSKLAGEKAILAEGPRGAILRTAWVYSPFGSNFVKTMLRKAREHDRLTVVDDQFGCPTAAHDLADVALSVTARLIGSEAGGPSDIFHVSGTGKSNWHGFAGRIMDISKQLGGPGAQVDPVSSDHYPTAARRPRNSLLDCTKLARIFDLTMPDWRESLRDCIARLLRDAEPPGNR